HVIARRDTRHRGQALPLRVRAHAIETLGQRVQVGVDARGAHKGTRIQRRFARFAERRVGDAGDARRRPRDEGENDMPSLRGRERGAPAYQARSARKPRRAPVHSGASTTIGTRDHQGVCMFAKAAPRRHSLTRLSALLLSCGALLVAVGARAATPTAAQRAAFKQAWAAAQQGGDGWRAYATKLRNYPLYPYLPAAAL